MAKIDHHPTAAGSSFAEAAPRAPRSVLRPQNTQAAVSIFCSLLLVSRAENPLGPSKRLTHAAFECRKTFNLKRQFAASNVQKPLSFGCSRFVPCLRTCLCMSTAACTPLAAPPSASWPPPAAVCRLSSERLAHERHEHLDRRSAAPPPAAAAAAADANDARREARKRSSRRRGGDNAAS